MTRHHLERPAVVSPQSALDDYWRGRRRDARREEVITETWFEFRERYSARDIVEMLLFINP